METDRRRFMHTAAGLIATLLAGRGGWSGGKALASAAPRWTTRQASADDAAELASVFNAHVAAGICPYSDRIASWGSAEALAYLEALNGSVLVEKDETVVGFVGLIDYSNPATTSRLAPGVEPEVGVLALHPGRLSATDLDSAARHLAAAAARRLRDMGHAGCTMRIPAQPIFDSEDWFARHMTVQRVRTRDGVDHAREVRFDVVAGLATLEAAGF